MVFRDFFGVNLKLFFHLVRRKYFFAGVQIIYLFLLFILIGFL